MAAEKNESTRNLLDEIEGEWDSPAAGSPTERKLHAALDAAAERLLQSPATAPPAPAQAVAPPEPARAIAPPEPVAADPAEAEAIEPLPESSPALDALDSGWDGDDEEEEDDEEEGAEEPEPELPDERLDPAAYAAAKKARDERAEARIQRRRAKAEAKKARRKARIEAQKQKQKGKQRKSRPAKSSTSTRPARAVSAARSVSDARRAPTKTARATANDDDDDALADVADVPRARKPSPNRIAKKPILSGTNRWMLALAVVIFLAAATTAAILAR